MVNRVLLVKLTALGDVIMASTLVPAIRKRWPAAELGWVVGRGAAPLVRGFEGVDQVIEVDEELLLRGGRVAAGLEVLSAWRKIGRGWDLALVAHTDPRYNLLARASGASAVRSFCGAYAPRPGAWHGAEYVRLLEDFVGTEYGHGHGDRESERTDVAPDRAAPYASIRPGLLPAPMVIPGDGPLVLLAPGGGRNVLRDDPLRRWPIASWEGVVASLRTCGYRVVAVGTAADAAEGARCAAAGSLDLTGRLSILELMALMHSAHAVVTHDSGALHLALLLHRPTVALFGPTRPSERIPEGAKVTVLSRAAGLSCAPCYNGREYAACATNRCLSDVGHGDVVRAVCALVSASS